MEFLRCTDEYFYQTEIKQKKAAHLGQPSFIFSFLTSLFYFT